VATVSQYAQHRGISPQAVRKAIAQGRLSKAVSEVDGVREINVEKADWEWEQNTQHSKRRPTEVINAGKAAAQGRAPAPVPPGGVELNYSKARAVREHFAAKLGELEYREKAGQLVRADEVKTATYKTIRLFRDSVQNIPIRVVNELAAIVGDLPPDKRHEMMQVMQREIDLALTQLSESHGPR
jgi:hypothetical protein